MAAEQLANLYQDTLADNYTIGQGYIIVTSGAGCPTQGPFSLTILNSSGTSILMVYRVATVGGGSPEISQQLNGAAETSDVNCPAGSLVIGTTLSVDAINNLLSAAGSPSPGANLYSNENPQPASGYTWDNQGSAALADLGSFSIAATMPADNSASVWHVAYQAVPGSTPYTLYVAMTVHPRFASNYLGQGICIGDSSGKYLAIIYSQSQASIYVFEVPSSTSSGSVVSTFGPSTNVDVPGYPYIYFKVTDDGTDLTFYFSIDQNTWVQMYQIGRTAYTSTPARMGMIWYNQTAAAASGFVCFSFGTTAPTAH